MTAQNIEDLIDLAYMRLQAAATPEARRKAWETLKHWKEQRAPEVVERIEKERGLR